jgi:hypothetical protein
VDSRGECFVEVADAVGSEKKNPGIVFENSEEDWTMQLAPSAIKEKMTSLTSDQTIPIEVVLPPLRKEYICFIQQQNTVPPVCQCKVCLQGELDVLCSCPEVT